MHGDTAAWAQQAADAAELTDQTPPPPGRHVWPFVVLALVVLAVAATVYVTVIRETGPPHPDKWDKRVQPFVDIVEEERDLDFEHPVFVDFLPEAEFTEQVTADEEDLSDEDRKEIEQFTGFFRALGLLEGDLDLFEQVNELNGGGIIGYYSFEDERIRVRGEELSPAVQSTLVHELTHALQDQHFDLEAMKKHAEEDDAASGALDSLIEGDARRIEAEWREGLDKAERKALEKDTKSQSDDADKDLAKVPQVLQTLMSAPYVFGEAMLATAVQDGGDEAVDELFQRPPSTEEHQLDPWTLIADHAVAIPVDTPGVTEKEDEFDDGTFGAIGWLLMLAERVPVDQALTAADGWGGDSYVAYEKKGVSCVRVAYAGDTPEDLTEMKKALGAWVAKGAKGAARSKVDGSKLVFQSCDPGAKARRVANESSRAAVRLALKRTYLSTQLVDTGVPIARARCSSDLLVRRLTDKQLNNPELDPTVVLRIIQPCLT